MGEQPGAEAAGKHLWAKQVLWGDVDKEMVHLTKKGVAGRIFLEVYKQGHS